MRDPAASSQPQRDVGDATSRERGERGSITSSPRWRWYRSRLGPTAVVATVVGAIGLFGAVIPKERWYEQSTPSPGSGLTRAARPWPGGFPLAAVVAPAPRDVHDSVLVGD